MTITAPRLAAAAAAAAVALALALSGAALADPRVDLDRCDALDRVALRRAVDAELAGLAADKRAAVDRVVVVRCPDAVTAHLELEPAPATGSIARSLDLGEVPTALRARLIALAVVELVEIAALVGQGRPSSPAPAPSPAAPTTTTPSALATTATTPPSAPATTAATPIDPTPLRDDGADPTKRPGPRPRPRPRTAALDPITAAPPGAAAELSDRLDPRPLGPLATRRALADGGPLLRGRALAPRVGLRIYPSHTVPMADVSVDLIQGVLSAGITGAFGQTDDELGTVRPFLVAGTAGVALACMRSGELELCVHGRLAAGLAGATASGNATTVEAAAATAPYLQLGGQLELAYRGRRRAVVLTLDGGWAEGMVANAGNHAAAVLDGVAIVAAIGARL